MAYDTFGRVEVDGFPSTRTEGQTFSGHCAYVSVTQFDVCGLELLVDRRCRQSGVFRIRSLNATFHWLEELRDKHISRREKSLRSPSLNRWRKKMVGPPV